MAQNTYRHPPIAEAVIEVRFEDNLATKMIERFQKKYNSRASNKQEINNFEIKIGDKEQKFEKTFRGYKFFLEDPSYLINIENDKMFTVRLAPYEGWGDFYSMFCGAFENLKTIYKGKFSRIGVRYINRFDIFNKGDEKMNFSEYFNIDIVTPDVVGNSFLSFFVNFMVPVADSRCNVMTRFGSIESKILDHHSFILDIDVMMDKDIPMRTDEIFAIVTSMREIKNSVFESCITDRTRELIRT